MLRLNADKLNLWLVNMRDQLMLYRLNIYNKLLPYNNVIKLFCDVF